MKGYLVRIAPLICESIGRRFCVTQLCPPVSRPGLCWIGDSPWVVEAQVVVPVPHWFYDRGQPGVSGNKKDTSSLRRGV